LLLGRPLEQGVEPRAFLDPDPLSASRTTTKKNSARNSRPVTTELVKVVAKMITHSTQMPLYRPCSWTRILAASARREQDLAHWMDVDLQAVRDQSTNLTWAGLNTSTWVW